MPTIEERLQQLIGAQVITICNLQTSLEQAQEKIEELEKKTNGHGEPHLVASAEPKK